MVDKWFISDTHFFHDNIIKFKGEDGKLIRPFASVDEMHSIMIERWNSVVKPGDKVYHLGDVTFKYIYAFEVLMKALKGNKRLVLGNHDKIKGTCLMNYFEKVDLWKGFPEGFTCSHIPLDIKYLRDGAYCVHGHIHQNVINNPNYINVCVEQINYTPIHLDEIVARIKARK